MRPPRCLLSGRLMTTMRPHAGGGSQATAPPACMVSSSAPAAPACRGADGAASTAGAGGVLARAASGLPTLLAGPAVAPTGPVVRHLCPPTDIAPGGLAAYVADEVGVTEVKAEREEREAAAWRNGGRKNKKNSTHIHFSKKIKQSEAAALLAFGACYWCPVPPPPPPGYAGAAEAAARTDAGRAQHGRGLHLATPRRASPGDAPPAGAYIRVHARPKLFPAAGDLTAAEWAARIVAVGGGGGGGGGSGLPGTPAAATPPAWAVLDKPPGVPSVPTVDNGVQHALAGAEAGLEAMGVPLPPHPPPWPARRQRSQGGRQGAPPPLAAGTLPAGGRLAAAHRLDQAASGLLVLAIDRAFVAAYSAAAAAGGVAKLYRAAVAWQGGGMGEEGAGPAPALPPSHPPLGPLTHWAARGAAAEAAAAALGPHGPARTHLRAGGEAAGGDARCELVVLAARPLPALAPPADAWAAAGGGGGCPGRPGGGAWEVSILLRTGRTHQVRAQLAAVGWPILGDGLYGGRGAAAALDAGGRADPAAPVCLQAARLEVRGGGVVALYGEAAAAGGAGRAGLVAFDAGAPWWRGGGGGGGVDEGEWGDVERWLGGGGAP